jgi:hypothetical protein
MNKLEQLKTDIRNTKHYINHCIEVDKIEPIEAEESLAKMENELNDLTR